MRKLKVAYVLLPIVAQLHVGCGGTLGSAVKAYPGAERQASEVSIIQCGFSLAIVAIDENKSLSGDSTACSFSLLPGRHVFRVSIAKKEFGLYPGTYRQQGDQVVEYDLVAGKTYSLHAFEDEKSPGLWRINMIDPVVDRSVTLKEVRLSGAKVGG
jgi:hypothetical protein